MKIICLTGFPERETKKKWGRIMRLTLFLMVGFLLTASASSYSQNTRLNIKLKNGTVTELMKYVEDNSEFVFLYKNEDLDLEKKVDVELENATIQQVLDAGFKGQNVGWDVYDRQIVIHKADRLLLPGQAAQQQRTVTGVVTDQSGLPLPGVTVVVTGTTTGTVTNADGNFSLALPDGAETLQFSFVGMKTQDLSINGRTTFTIVMEEETIGIEEVVAIGYGTQRRSDITGSVTKVTSKEIQEIPSNSVESILQGRAAGLQVITSSQEPGASSIVRIRGNSSLRASNSPLIVVDGFPLGDAGNLKQINPADIESVEILKDASSSAIYGSRGANGVIIVTTRKAKTGKTTISVMQQTTLSQFTSELNLWRDPVLMAQLNNESRRNGGFDPLYVGAVSPAGTYYPSVEELLNNEWPHNTRWDDIVFRELPISNNTTLKISSSNEKTSFNLSGNYFTDKGVYIEDDYSKLNYKLDVSHNIYENLKITFSNILTSGIRNSNGGLAYWRNPIWPVYDENGDYFLTSNNDFGHPVAITDNQLNKSKTLDVLSYIDIEYSILPNLVLTSRMNYKYGNSISDQYSPKKYTQTGTFNNGHGSINNWAGNVFVSETFVNYSKLFRNVHSLNAMAGYSYQTDKTRTSYLGAVDFVNEALRNENLATGNPESFQISNGLSQTELVSGYFRLNYSYNNKYLLTFTSRADGSSKFGENNKWAYFPSGAISWKVHEEDFIQQLNIFDELKLRASYGISGQQGISPYQTLSRYGTSKYFNNGNWVTSIGPGLEVGRTGQDGIEVLWGGIPNPDLKWETTAQLDLGLDFSVFNDRLNIIFDYYEKLTNDLLQERILPPSSGYDRMWVNNGSIENKGIELTINSGIIHSKDFQFNTSLIYYRNRNKVTSLGNVEESGLQTDPNTGMLFTPYGNSIEMFREFPNLLAVGQPVNVFYGYVTDGIVQTLEEGVGAGLEGDFALPGEFKYVDINNDGYVDDNDRTIIGNPNPDFMASLNLNVVYKKFDITAFFNGVFGNDVLNMKSFDQPSNQPLRWTPDNPTNDYPSLKGGRQTKFSDWWLEDGSFVRIQNLNLGYTTDIASNISGRLFLNASNLYTFTKFDGYDPEVGTNGRYGGGYPRIRRLTLGLNLTF